MPPYIFDRFPLMDSLIAATMERNTSCESLYSETSATSSAASESASEASLQICGSSGDSIRTMATSTYTSTTHSTVTRPPSLVIGGARHGPRKRVSFCPSVTTRSVISFDASYNDEEDDEDEELGADLSTATKAERAIYKHTLRSKGMAVARKWWEAKQKEKRRAARRSSLR